MNYILKTNSIPCLRLAGVRKEVIALFCFIPRTIFIFDYQFLQIFRTPGAENRQLYVFWFYNFYTEELLWRKFKKSLTTIENLATATEH